MTPQYAICVINVEELTLKVSKERKLCNERLRQSNSSSNYGI